MLSQTKIKINWTFVTNVSSSVFKDSSHRRLQQQSVKHLKKTYVGPSRNIEEKEQEKKKYRVNAKTIIKAIAKLLGLHANVIKQAFKEKNMILYYTKKNFQISVSILL